MEMEAFHLFLLYLSKKMIVNFFRTNQVMKNSYTISWQHRSKQPICHFVPISSSSKETIYGRGVVSCLIDDHLLATQCPMDGTWGDGVNTRDRLHLICESPCSGLFTNVGESQGQEQLNVVFVVNAILKMGFPVSMADNGGTTSWWDFQDIRHGAI